MSSRFYYDQITPLYTHDNEVYILTFKKRMFRQFQCLKTTKHREHCSCRVLPSPVYKESRIKLLVLVLLVSIQHGIKIF